MSAQIIAFPGCRLPDPHAAPAPTAQDPEAVHLEREMRAAIELWSLLGARHKRTGRAPESYPNEWNIKDREGSLRVANLVGHEEWRDHVLRCIAEEVDRLAKYKKTRLARSRKREV